MTKQRAQMQLYGIEPPSVVHLGYSQVAFPHDKQLQVTFNEMDTEEPSRVQSIYDLGYEPGRNGHLACSGMYSVTDSRTPVRLVPAQYARQELNLRYASPLESGA